MIGYARNKKNGKTYTIIELSINTTNAQDGQILVKYIDANGGIYNRELLEFKEKFEPNVTHELNAFDHMGYTPFNIINTLEAIISDEKDLTLTQEKIYLHIWLCKRCTEKYQYLLERCNDA